MNFIQKYHFLNNSFDKKKTKSKAMVCFPVMISMNLKTHTNTTRKHLSIEKNGGGDFTTGGEIFNFETLLVKYDY